ncbi:hypothetical protein [Roseovarius sp. 2305UL8-3]|uniref:hypothetical protein n=1 Tax=Roseovarius conchicola TaxID=3121636 RepID=UPI0035282E46
MRTLGASFVIASSLAVLPSFSLAQDPTPVFAQDDPARIWIEGNEMYFFGEISIASQDAFLEIIDSEAASRVQSFVVNSGGGDTNSGRVIGRWIHEQGLNVTVEAICFSSCANYIFTAGATRTIRAGAFVGWHGSENQYDVIAESDPDQSGDDLERAALRTALIPALPENATSAEIEQAIDQQIAFAEISRQDEADFFETIGISSEVTLHGLRPGNLDALQASGLAGWTFTLEDMDRLGLGFVEYLGEGPYETSPQVAQNVLVVSYDPDLAAH